MKNTGIVRRIDDLGRIVIPKEIRKTLKIHEGSPLEIYTDNNGAVVFQKYSPVGEMDSTAKIYADVLSDFFNCPCVITDTDKVIAVAGTNKNNYIGENISERLTRFTTQNKLQMTNEPLPITDLCDKFSQISQLINYEGNSIGTINLFDIPNGLEEKEISKTLKLVSRLLGRQTE